MIAVYVLACLVVGAISQNHGHNHNSELIYHEVIHNVWLSSDTNDDGIFERFELTGVFAYYDDNGDGDVTFHEYTDSIEKHSPMMAYTSAVFAEFDANHDDLLDSPDVDIVYSNMDTDNNKQVSKEEFTAFWLDILRKTAHLHGHGLHLGHH